MNRIVRQHYPIEKLPLVLREGLGATGQVTVTVEAEADPDAATPLTLDEIFALRRGPFKSKEEIDRELRAQRDEWE